MRVTIQVGFEDQKNELEKLTMPMPDATKKKYATRFEELIREGRKLLDEKKIIPGRFPEKPGYVGSGRFDRRSPDLVTVDVSAGDWMHKVKTILGSIVPARHPNRELVDSGLMFQPNASGVGAVLSLLAATHDDFTNGFLDDFGVQIEAGIAAEYLSHADGLVERSSKSSLSHVLSAFVAGVVLERFLRQLLQTECPEQDKDKPLTLNPLITALQKAGLVSPTKAKMLHAWSGIRNDVAHGNFEKVDPGDVKRMVEGVTEFINQNS